VKRPAEPERFRGLVSRSDALLFATPEYNFGIPGVLKNAIDWASRPAFDCPLTGKPAGILSASRSPVGGARAQGDLRLVLAGTLSPVFPHVDMLLPGAHEKFDETGSLTDAKTRDRLERYAGEFLEWVGRQRG